VRVVCPEKLPDVSRPDLGEAGRYTIVQRGAFGPGFDAQTGLVVLRGIPQQAD